MALGLGRVRPALVARRSRHELQPLGARVQAVATQRAPDPEMRSPPQRSRRSSAEMGLGPKPGWASAKARMRCSRCGPSSFGMRGLRRSRGRRASNPQRST